MRNVGVECRACCAMAENAIHVYHCADHPIYTQADLDAAIAAATKDLNEQLAKAVADEREACADTIARMRNERSTELRKTPLGETYRDGPCAGASVWNVESRSLLVLSEAENAIRARGGA